MVTIRSPCCGATWHTATVFRFVQTQKYAGIITNLLRKRYQNDGETVGIDMERTYVYLCWAESNVVYNFILAYAFAACAFLCRE